jgi:hypothetical protein
VIHGTGRTGSERQGHDAAFLDYYDAALQQEQAALCLSDGGIHCAAFSLDIDIEFDLAAVRIGSCEKQPSPFRNFAFAKINCRAGPKLGEFIYRKPVDLPAVSMDDSAYRNLNLTFPTVYARSVLRRKPVRELPAAGSTRKVDARAWRDPRWRRDSRV